MCLGVPGEIIAIDEQDRQSAIVQVSGVRRLVNLACVLPPGTEPDSLIGQWVLVHVGFAMSLIDADEARKTLALLAELDAFGEASSPPSEVDDAVR